MSDLEAQGGSNPTSTDLDKILRRHLDDRPEGYSLFKQAIDDYTARVANKAVADALWRLKAKQGAAKLYSPEMLVVGVGYIHSELAALTKEDV